MAAGTEGEQISKNYSHFLVPADFYKRMYATYDVWLSNIFETTVINNVNSDFVNGIRLLHLWFVQRDGN